jgi:hypothetical protein
VSMTPPSEVRLRIPIDVLRYMSDALLDTLPTTTMSSRFGPDL